MKLDINMLYTLIYFEMNYRDSALSVADSFKHFLKSNNKLSEEIKVNHLNFLKFLISIINLKENHIDLFKVQKLRKEINDYSYLIRKSWLLKS
ncbi:MAG: hypothetical protein IPL53_23550 [Ignavibacteria bacterium]|nr:hypothetical protein [Ignavibacteria bacterium]